MTRHIRTAVAVLAAAAGAAWGQVGTAFTYQGELTDASLPAQAVYDFQFRLFDSAGGATQVGPTLCSDNVSVADGRFVVSLDFGSAYTGAKRFLEISVRADTGGNCLTPAGFLTLGPRQELTVAPYAAFALAAQTAATATDAQTLGGQAGNFFLNRANQTGIMPSAGLAGSYTAALQLTNASNVFAGNGSNLTNLSANAVTTGTLPTTRGGTGASIASATVGQVLKWNGTSFTPGPDLDTTYIAGAGLTLSATTFLIGPNAINSSMILDSTITGSDIAAGAVAGGDLAIDGTSLARVSGGALSASGTALTAAGALTVTGNVLTSGTVTANGFIAPSTPHVMIVPAAAFTGDAKIVHDNGTNLEFVSSGSTAVGTSGYAAVHLPNGAVVTAVRACILDSSVLTNVTVLLLRRTPDNSLAGGTMASMASTGSDPNIRTFSDTSISAATIDNDTYMYYLRADFPAGASLYIDNPNLSGVKIEYTTDSPAPW